MKRMSFTTLFFSVLFAANIFAVPTYQMDETTALDMRLLGSSTGDYADLWFVGTDGGVDQLPGYGSDTYGSIQMGYEVGFTGTVNEGTVKDGFASAVIGLEDPYLSGSYDSFLLPVSNDNGDVWQYRAYVIVNDSTIYYSDGGAWVSVDSGSKTTLLVDLGGLIDFSTVTGIGYEIQWSTALNDGDTTGDQFSTSVVPVPGALLLGLIGLGSLRLKFRKSV